MRVAVDGVLVHGPTLASLLQSILAAGRPVDGLLLGRVQSSSYTHVHDTAGAAVVRLA